MDQKNAVALLEETFEQEFDIDRFANFIKELFNHFKVSVHDVPLWKEYYDYVETVNSLGVYRDSDRSSIEVFAIKLKRTSSRDRARTMQRNLIARYLTKFNLDAALVAFYGDDPEDWRFSFVKMEYELTKDEKGNLKVTEELTPARRYSFLVGKNEPNHTCKIQFLGLIKEEADDPLITQIEETFSIEKVTKEFFNEYKELYLKLKESLEKSIENDEIILQDFENKVIKTSDFAKKLMGQIVFIYFLQKKGWLGVEKGKKWGTGPKKFLRRLFNGEIMEYDNFFNDVLEHLFYDALSSKHDEDYYDKFACKIPFLNGGLFEPINDYDWKKTDIQLKNDIFEKILDTFDQYNFTVKEDEPLEKEVAVDPEMLGKVFENLLEIEDRKSKGAFYTPREIVHYMCQESLINYLNTNSNVRKEDLENFIRLGDVALGSIIKQQEELKQYRTTYKKSVLPDSIKDNHEDLDKLLRDIKIVDPAVGSGAFPVGMMNEIIRARTILSLYSGNDVTNYELKLETIKNCLYGIDIDSSAVDVAKLRFWLSLIVDEEDVIEIDPLPNLDHKIMCGNSLLDEFEGVKLFDERLLAQDIHDTTTQSTLDRDFNIRLKKSQIMLKDLKKLQSLFFKEQDSQQKIKYKEKIDSIEWELIEETLIEEDNEDAIELLAEYKSNNSKPFFVWKLYFAEVFRRENPGFDVVIANPPYRSAWSMEKDDPTIRKKISKCLNDFGTLKGHWDLYIAFIALGTKILRDDGTLSYIVPNPILREKYALPTRKYFLTKMKLESILAFSEINVFENVSRRTSVFIINKTISTNYNIYIFESPEYEKNPIIEHINTVKSSKWLNNHECKFIIKTDDVIENIMEKIDKSSDKIGNYFYVNYGAQVSSKEKGKFRKKDVVSTKPVGNAKKFIEGKDVHKWHLSWRSLWLDYRKNEMYGPRDYSLFENKKILVRKVSDKNHRIAAVLDDSNMFCDDGTVIVTPYINIESSDLQTNFKGYTKKEGDMDLRYVLAFLLSSFTTFFFRNRFATESLQGSTSHTYPKSIRDLPILNIPLDKQKPFVALVDKIFIITLDDNYLKNTKKLIEVSDLENEIDSLIYQLYELDSHEIEKIDNFINNEK